MKPILLILLFLSCAGNALSHSVENCPNLPADSELIWSYTQGPDFEICRAMRGDRQVFGMYLGNHPKFRPNDRQRAEKGKIGKYEVLWYNKEPSKDSTRPISKQAIFNLGQRPDAEMAHVWFNAADIEELNQTLAILQLISFK